MENTCFLNNIDDVLYPEFQTKNDELDENKKEEKHQRKAEYIKNHPEYYKSIEQKKDYKKAKAKERNYIRRQNEKQKIYQQVKNMSKEEKEKFYDNYYKDKEIKKQKIKENLKNAYNSNFIICFDLDYDIYMDNKELRSLALQLSICHKLNKYNKTKINYYFTSIKQELIDEINKNNGDKWPVHYEEKPFYLIEELINLKKEFIYLSPDAKEDLDDVSEDKIYIIGGLVDRQVIKNRSMIRFNNIKNNNNEGNKEIKIQAKRLPLQKYLDNINNPILNVNTVVEILSLYMDMEKDKKDWKKALECTLPKRKIEIK